MERLIRIAFTLVLAFAWGLTALPVMGHEFWIEPTTWRPESGAVFGVEFRHGERFRGDRVPRRNELIDRFTLVGALGETTIIGRDGGRASFVKAAGPGLHVIGYRSRRMAHHLDAAAFEAYLAEEGLDRVAALRATRGEQDEPGREVYSRCAKALVAIGDVETDDGSAHDDVLGFPLEIVLETDPYALDPDDPLVARVLHDGKPLAGATVVAVSASTPEQLVEQTTDAEGRVRFDVREPGAWMLTTIHMVPAPADVDADWESFWASFTFGR